MRFKRKKTNSLTETGMEISCSEKSAQEENSIELLRSLDAAEDEMQTFYDEMTMSDDLNKTEIIVQTKLASFRRASSNILKAYQRIAIINDELSARWNDLAKSKRRKIIPAPPPNAVIDLAEKNPDYFARGISPYKLLLVFYIGSFLGVAIELLWCFLTRGYIESRSGLVVGPLNPLYGFGAVAFTVALYRFRNKGRWISFLGGMFVGSIVEYFCSWGQEFVVGSRSWDYSDMPFNLNGRICLLYSAFWGILGVFLIKTVYPWLAKFILKIPNRAGKWITWIFGAIYAVDCILTLFALLRWSQRVNFVETTNPFWQFFDSAFPNERMEKIYANMEFN